MIFKNDFYDADKELLNFIFWWHEMYESAFYFTLFSNNIDK